MLLRKLLDPDETARRRKLRAWIVRRNRIQRELALGLEPKWRRLPKANDLTVNDYGWNPLEDGTAAVADRKRVEKEGNALAFLVKAAEPTEAYAPSTGDGPRRLRSPVVMEGVDHVPARFANRATAVDNDQFKVQGGSSIGFADSQARGGRHLALHPGSRGGATPARPRNERVSVRWRDALQLLMIQRHEEVLRKDANRPWRQERLGLLLYERKRYKQASEHLVLAIKLGATSSICWRRLAQCHWYEYASSQDWDALWDAKAAFEQALNHVEMACNPYVLYEYARVLEALGSYDSALNACASLLSTFPKFAQVVHVRLRFVLLQRYQILTFSEGVKPGERERGVVKCIDMTKALLLDKTITTSAQYPLVLYLQVRLNELLHEASAKRGEGPGTVAKAARESADHAANELYKAALALGLVTQTSASVSWRLWRLQSETYLQWADHFQSMNENIAAADALARALELMETPPALPASLRSKQPDQITDLERKIALYLAMATNYYLSNQMERAIRAMETIFQLSPFVQTVRQSLVAWFPAKWKDRIELEDASQVQIARVLRGLWGRARASKRRRAVEQQLEAAYRAHPFHAFHRRNVLRLLKVKYAPLFAAQDLAARRIQQAAHRYLTHARIRWACQDRKRTEIRGLRAKHSTAKYRYNHIVRFQLAQLVPDQYEKRFRREDQAAALIQRWFRGECVRKAFHARRAGIRTQRERERQVVERIQRRYRLYKARNTKRADQTFIETHRRMQLAREQLARQLQRLYYRRKHRLELAMRLELQRLHCHRQDATRQASVMWIQQSWRRYVASKRGGSRGSEAAVVLDQLRRGHQWIVAAENEQQLPALDDSARKIQVVYRGKRIRASLANITRHAEPPTPSEVQQLREICEKCHAAGEAPRVMLSKIETISEKRALYDFPVVVITASTETDDGAPLSITHLAQAVEFSNVLDTLLIECADLTGTRAATLFGPLQRSKKIRKLALGAVRFHSKRRESELSLVPEDEEGEEEQEDDSCSTPMAVLSETLRTNNFLLEELLLKGNDLLLRQRDGRLLASTVGDYFYGRYGKLRVLAAETMGIADETGACFGDALAINTVLQRLNLSGNAIRDAGAASIASRGLSANASLVYLNLADNSIGSVGAKALFACLETSNRTLKTLVLTNNTIMNDAMPLLHRALQANAVVEQVNLRGNLIHDDHVVVIEATMRERTATTNEELRLFLTRRRLSGLHISGGKRTDTLSPVRHAGTVGKRRIAPMSPQKWIKANASSCKPSLLLQSPCAVFRHSGDGLVSSIVQTSSPNKKRHKPPHALDDLARTRLPVLPMSPGKRGAHR